MTKTLKVIEPFFGLEYGDTMELSADKKTYIAEYSSEYKADDEDATAKASYKSQCSISLDYAKSLIEDGVLAEVPEKNDREFVNVFGEIDKMLATYTHDLDNLERDEKNTPECLKVEKRTVLNNLIKVLTYLKSLRK